MLLNALSIILYQVLTYFELTNSINFITIFIVIGALLKVRLNLSHNQSYRYTDYRMKSNQVISNRYYLF